MPVESNKIITQTIYMKYISVMDFRKYSHHRKCKASLIQTANSAPIRRAAVRGTGASRQPVRLINPFVPTVAFSQPS